MQSLLDPAILFFAFRPDEDSKRMAAILVFFFAGFAGFVIMLVGAFGLDWFIALAYGLALASWPIVIANGITLVKGWNPGTSFDQVVARFPAAQMDPKVYDTGPIRNDMEMVFGVSDAASGSVVDAKTATEAEIVQAQLQALGFDRLVVGASPVELGRHYAAPGASAVAARRRTGALAGAGGLQRRFTTRCSATRPSAGGATMNMSCRCALNAMLRCMGWGVRISALLTRRRSTGFRS